MIKILAYKYPTYVDVSLQREVKPLLFSSLKENVQDTIKKLLFDENHDYLLIALTFRPGHEVKNPALDKNV